MKIKQIPEDFIVEEIIDFKISEDKHDYSIIKLKKKNWESFKIIDAIAKNLRTRQKFIGFAGNKDKNAVTTQYISIYKTPKERIEKIKVHDAELEFLSYSKNRINLGGHLGNKFIITIRDLNKERKLPKDLQLENYFDDQRFGSKSNTHLVGKSIIKRDFKEACNLLKLKVQNNDYIGALRQQQRRLLRFYISSYQSYLWNKNLTAILSKNKDHTKVKYSVGELVFLKNKTKEFALPLPNFDIELNKELSKILKEEGIEKDNFIIKEIPELINTAEERSTFINVKDIKYNWGKDELNKEKLKLEVSFFLPKGSYATMLIKKLGIYLNFKDLIKLL